jgi:type VI secretion system secreted protein VgrG
MPATAAAVVYDGSGERIAQTRDAADRHSQLMLQALELDNKRFEGTGAVRRLAAGHASADPARPLSRRRQRLHRAVGAARGAQQLRGTGIANAARGGRERHLPQYLRLRARYRGHRPRFDAAPHPCTAPGPQTALVVGLADAVSTTTRDHQVRIQFPWQRGTQPQPRRHGAQQRQRGQRARRRRSGTWVRVAEALAGPELGHAVHAAHRHRGAGRLHRRRHRPPGHRRPAVTPASDLPPFAAGVDSGVEHAGTLSGIHTHNFRRRRLQPVAAGRHARASCACAWPPAARPPS